MNGLIKSAKIGEANGMPNLPNIPTHLTLRGNVGSLDAPRASQLFTFGPRGQGMHRDGCEWSQKMLSIAVSTVRILTINFGRPQQTRADFTILFQEVSFVPSNIQDHIFTLKYENNYGA